MPGKRGVQAITKKKFKAVLSISKIALFSFKELLIAISKSRLDHTLGTWFYIISSQPADEDEEEEVSNSRCAGNIPISGHKNK